MIVEQAVANLLAFESKRITAAEAAEWVENLVTNPSGETGTTGCSAVAGTSGVASVTNPTATTAFGTKVLRATWSTASTAAGGGITFDVPVVAGTTYSFGLGHLLSSITNRLQLSVEWRTASATISTVTDAAFVATAATVYAKSLAGQVAPATATVARVKVLSVAGTSYANWSVGSYLQIDGLVAVVGSVVPASFDGSTADADDFSYEWSGPAHASTSRRWVTWREWTGSLNNLDAQRGGKRSGASATVEVGTLSGELLNAGDPLDEPDWKPNLVIRLRHRTTRDTVFTGRVVDLSTTYVLNKDTNEMTTRVAFVAADAVSSHAAVTRYGAVSAGGAGYESWAQRIARLATSAVAPVTLPADDAPFVRYAI